MNILHNHHYQNPNLLQRTDERSLVKHFRQYRNQNDCDTGHQLNGNVQIDNWILSKTKGFKIDVQVCLNRILGNLEHERQNQNRPQIEV
ncbi:hypothetical protein OGATHE_001046 [Ogataea polymorpha]|uniref:Uncharacterized protein n=1 Tax=Ogataea polymorpha TaxID=460523 RepID=A0A9P8PS23_9ASCO|nr:hypothetical protein OGATHE_001046 [Ogataea polymorpha]